MGQRAARVRPRRMTLDRSGPRSSVDLPPTSAQARRACAGRSGFWWLPPGVLVAIGFLRGYSGVLRFRLGSQVSLLCRWVLPGQADGLDFCQGRLFGPSGSKSGGDEDAAELGEHVGGGWVGLGAVPGPAGAVGGDVVGLVAG